MLDAMLLNSEMDNGNTRVLSDRHHQVARLLAMGWSNQEIAEHMGLNPSYVSQLRCKRPEVRGQVDRLHAEADRRVIDVRQELQDMLPLAVEALRDILEDQDDRLPASLKYSTAKTIMGLNGHVVPKNVRVMNVTAAASPEQVANILNRLTANAKRANLLEDHTVND